MTQLYTPKEFLTAVEILNNTQEEITQESLTEVIEDNRQTEELTQEVFNFCKQNKATVISVIKVNKETEKAVNIYGTIQITSKNRGWTTASFWIPKSQILSSLSVDKFGEEAIYIPSWLARKVSKEIEKRF